MDNIQSWLRTYYRQADRFMLAVLWGLFVMALALSGMHDTVKWVLLVGLPTVLLATAMITWSSGARLTRYGVAAALMAMAALHIHQAAGVPELHFGVFVLLSFLLCYRDWSVILVAAAVVVVHHLSFNYLQQWGYGVICFTAPTLGAVFVHAAYVVAEAGVLSYLAIILQREAVQAAELQLGVRALTDGAGGTIRLSVQGRNPTSPSGVALQRVVQMLNGAVVRVRHSTDTIAQAAQQITAGNSALSDRTVQQASAVATTVASMAELTEAVQQNEAQAKNAHEMASASSAIATRGGAVVMQVVTTMQSIAASARQIGEITSIVDGIAFQTNILALNAAVEAARAGEQGRGFAVVASEVRNLAQRSASAARDIKALITDSVTRVDTGSLLAAQAGETMLGIVQSIEAVDAVMNSILAVSRTQRQGIDKVNRALEDMHAFTRNNASLVDQAAHAAVALKEQSNDLVNVVGVFDLSDGAPAVLPRSANLSRGPHGA